MAPRVVSARELLAQRNVFVGLAAALAQDEPGGVLSVGLDCLVSNMALAGGLAYRRHGRDLHLVAEHRVPRKAQAWLKHLTLDDEDPWFAAQRAVGTMRPVVDTDLAKSRAGVSIAPALREAGWGALAAIPVAIGRQVKGVLVVAVKNETELDRECLRVLEAAGGILALALAREEQRERESERVAEAATVQLATVGLVATSLAEELAGPLRTLQRQLEHQRRLMNTMNTAEMGSLADEMIANATAALTVSTRLAASIEPSPPVTLDLGRVVRSAVATMREHADARQVAIDLTIDDGDHAVDGREAELYMLVVQLIMHGVRRCAGAPDARLVMSLDAEDERIMLSLSTSKRLRTTKKSGVEIFEALMARGVAADIERIGLSLARQTVLAHHGHVEAGSSPLGGVQIRLVFPSSRLMFERPSRTAAPVQDISSDDRPTLLLIDEDEVWTGAVRRFLEGYVVHTANSCAEARALLAAFGDNATAIFVTVSLPDGSGLDLYRAAPALASRFVFLCDGVLPLDDASDLRGSGCPTLIKPLTVEEVSVFLDQRGQVRGVPTLQPSTSSHPPRE